MANNNYKIANSFDPMEAIRRIYGYKGDWETANKNAWDAKVKANNDATKKILENRVLASAQNATGEFAPDFSEANRFEAVRDKAAQDAQPYYAALRANGYGDIADKLTAADYTGAGIIKDYYGMLGKTPVREYARNGLKKYGLSDADADKIITWNDKTGEVGIGGINLGKPDMVSSDGVSYTGNTGAIDDAIAAYAKNRGLSTSIPQKWNDTYDTALGEASAMSGKVRESADISNEALRKSIRANDTYFNEAQTPTARSADYRQTWRDVMPAYEYDADRAGRNAAASGASANGGNIDSFAAANARRQREASYANGARLAAELGIGARQATMANMNQGVQNYIAGSSQGAQNAQTMANANVTNTRAFNDLLTSATGEMNDQATRGLTNAQAENTRAQSDYLYGQMLGQNTARAVARLYPGFFNEDGTPKDTLRDTDFKAIIDDLEANNKDGKNNALIAAVNNMRYYKGTSSPEYTHYLSEGSATPIEFGQYTEAAKRDKAAYELAKLSADVQKYGIDSEERRENAKNEMTRLLAEMGYSHEAAENEANRMLDWSKSQLAANTDITTTSIAAGLGADGTGTAAGAIDDSEVKAWVKTINKDLGDDTVEETEPGMYKIKNQKYKVIGKVMDSTSLTNEQKIYLLNVFGVTEEDIAAYNNINRKGSPGTTARSTTTGSSGSGTTSDTSGTRDNYVDMGR